MHLHLQDHLGYPVLRIECQHHVRELPVKALQRVVSGRKTTGPGETPFTKFHNIQNEVKEELMDPEYMVKEFDWDRYSIVATPAPHIQN